MQPEDRDGGFSMSMGPGRNPWCCGKPAGCTNTRGMSPEDPGTCSFLGHRWKLGNIPGHREAMAARRVGTREQLQCR